MADNQNQTVEQVPREIADIIALSVKSTVEQLAPEITKSMSEAHANAVTAMRTDMDIRLQDTIKSTVNPLSLLMTENKTPAKAWRKPEGWKGTEKDLHIAAKFLLMTQAKAEEGKNVHGATARFAKYYSELENLGEIKTLSAGNAGAGGFLVPSGFDAMLIDMAEEYGIFSQLGFNVNMNGLQETTLPRLDSGFTAYWLAEAGALTAGNMGGGQINLKLRGLGAVTKYTRQLEEGSAISLVPLIARKFAEQLAYKKDYACVNGAGLSTEGGIEGLITKLLATYTSTTTDSTGVIIGAGNLFSELTLTNFIDTVSLLRGRFRAKAKWLVSRKAEAAMNRLATAAGGVTGMEVINGLGMGKFLGYPVIVSDVMPAEANSATAALFGDFTSAAFIGTSGGIQIETATQNESDWLSNLIATKAYEQFDYNVFGHTSTDVAGNAQSGAYVGLRLAAS